MKKVLYQIISVFLAFVVLFSTFSFTVEKHLCAGEIVDYTFVGKLERCGMPEDILRKDTSDAELNKISCCQDIVEIIEGTNSELRTSYDLNSQDFQIAVAFIYTYVNLFDGLAEHKVPFKEYSTPLVTKDIQVLYDTFLI